MKTMIKGSVLALLIGSSVSAIVHADQVTTLGGIKVKTADGNFDASLGGRIQFDGYLDSTDKNANRIGSGSSGDGASSFEFRRVWLSLAGHAYGFGYHIDYDFTGSQLNEAWLSHGLLGGTVYAGQHKPWASLDELASNANTPFLERNIASASGVYSTANYTQGVYYAWHKPTIVNDDSLWLGVSVASLHKQSGGSDTQTQGLEYNARVAYAPVVKKNEWLHFGASYVHADADAGSTTAGSGALAASYVYGNHFDSNEKLTLASYSVGAAGGNPHSDTVGAELAGAYGPGFLQAEFVNAAFSQQGQPGNTVRAYSVTGAYALTGESRAYDKGKATYGGIKPLHSYGAVELALRYEYARNDGHGGSYAGLKLNGASSAAATKDTVSLLTVGVNYYVNPAVRFTLDYERGTADLGAAGKDSPNTVGARAQILF